METQKNTRNRLVEAVPAVQKRLDALSSEKLNHADEAATVDDEMIIMFQNKQAQAHAGGLLSFDEASYLYNLFGRELPTAERFNKQSLADRIVGMKAIAELMQ